MINLLQLDFLHLCEYTIILEQINEQLNKIKKDLTILNNIATLDMHPKQLMTDMQQ